MDKASKRNPGSLPLGERVARIEGKVSVLTYVDCAELGILVMILIALLTRS